MNNSELISRIATALIKGDMYDRVSYHSFLTFQYFSDSIWHYLQHVCGDFEARHWASEVLVIVESHTMGYVV